MTDMPQTAVAIDLSDPAWNQRLDREVLRDKSFISKLKVTMQTPPLPPPRCHQPTHREFTNSCDMKKEGYLSITTTNAATAMQFSQPKPVPNERFHAMTRNGYCEVRAPASWPPEQDT